MHFLLFCLPICSWCEVFFNFFSREERIPALIPPTVTTGAAVGFSVIVRSAGLAILAKVAGASSNDAAADLGQGLFFWDSRRTCWTRIRSAASTSEYHTLLLSSQRGLRVLCQDLPHRPGRRGPPSSRGHQPCILFEDIMLKC